MKLETAEDQLEEVLAALPENGTLLEWGMGGSTLWFASRLRPTQRLVSIEHDPRWYWSVRAEMPVAQGEVVLECIPSTVRDFNLLPYGHPGKENPLGLTDYIHARKTRDDQSTISLADVVFVDGVARGACIAVTAALARRGTTVFLHDAQRPWYGWARELLLFRQAIPSDGPLLAKMEVA